MQGLRQDRKKGLVFLRGAAMLTVCSLLMRTVGVGFNVYITGVLGAGGVGLFSLITSAYGSFPPLRSPA